MKHLRNVQRDMRSLLTNSPGHCRTMAKIIQITRLPRHKAASGNDAADMRMARIHAAINDRYTDWRQ